VERDRYPLTYRAPEAQQVMNWIEGGQSGCLVGLRGAGKSNFLRFLLRQDVRQHYLEQDYTDFAFVLTNLLALTERTQWAFYELMLDRLLAQLSPLDVGPAEEMATLHQEITRSRDPLAAQRAVERCVGILCQQPAQRVVLLFDEFDSVFRDLDSSLFRCLRTIRDAYKSQVCYIVVVTNELSVLRNDLTEVEHFYRLVSRNVCGLGPYSKADAQHMICYLASRRSVGLDPNDTDRLVELSGGHAGLLKAILSLLGNAHYKGSLAKLALALNDEPAVQAECRKVWDGLPDSEQAALCALAGRTHADPHILRRLLRKGLVRKDRPESPLFSPLFADYVCRQTPPSTGGTVISRSPPIVQVDGRPIEDLTELEFEILCYLYEHQGKVCTKDDLIENVYRQQYDRMKGGVTDGTLQTLISRLRAKIEPGRRHRYIVTVRREGYKFVAPDTA
jgi:hypothetical protein